jgi:hypothetical protein
MEYNRLITTPAHASSQQHQLIAVSLAAHQTGTHEPSEIAAAFDVLNSMVTYLVQSDTQFAWDGLGWVYDSRTTYSYSGTNLTEMITQDYDDQLPDWVNSSRVVNTYHGNGRIATTTGYSWDGLAWEPITLSTYSYDGSANMTSFLLQFWTGTEWGNQFLSTMTYNGSVLATTTTQMWASGMWNNFRRNVYTYSSGRLIEDMSQAPAGPSWADAERTTYSYDGSGRMTLALSERWGVSGPWANWYKSEYSYDGSTTNEILEVNSTWDGAAWDLTYADTSRYAANRRSELVSVYFFTGFESVLRTLYYYDGNGNLIEDIEQGGAGGGVYFNSLRGVYVYITAGIFDDVAATGMPSRFSLAQNYPNPFNQSTLIPYSLAGDSHVRITVTNILGQTIATAVDAFQTAGSHTASWDGRDGNSRDVASGIYFFRIQVGDASQVRKMVLLK